MTQKPDFFGLQGGLDKATPAIACPPGRAINALNHESLSTGYARCQGYERFDGRMSPTAAGRATIGDEDAKRAARDAARALIAKPPGSGDIRGVVRMAGATYCWRDAADGLSGIMYKAGIDGWAAVATGHVLTFTSGGTYQVVAGDVITAATGGGTATVRNVRLTSGTWAGGDAAGELTLTDVTGTFTPGNLDVGANLNVATFAVAPAAQGFPAGGRYFFRIHNFFGGAATRAIYGVNGVGKAFSYDGTSLIFITTGSSPDTPIRVGTHKDILALAFPGGSLQGSDLGNPYSWTGLFGAFEFGMGCEIADIISNNTDSMVVLGRQSIGVMTGATDTDLALSVLTDEAGAIPYTAQRIGTAIYLDNRGLRSITAAQEYGNFRLGSLTELAKPLLEASRKGGIKPIASVVVRAKDHYRLYYENGTGFSMYFGRKFPELMPFSLGFVVSSIWSGEDDDGTERVFAGSREGYVYELDVGTSYDGAAISAFIQLAFNHQGSPRYLKRWHSMTIEMIAAATTSLGVALLFDYGGTEQPGGGLILAETHGMGGLWGVANWGEFNWSAPIEGQMQIDIEGEGANISPIIASESDDEESYVLQGITNNFSLRGMKR